MSSPVNAPLTEGERRAKRIPVGSPCLACGQPDSRVLFEGDDSLDLASVGSSRTKLSHGRILVCRACGFAFRSFRPTVEQLSSLYRAADDRAYEAETANRRKTARRHRRIVERFHAKPGSVLDVGCASGAFLQIMGEGGWKLTGIEPSAAQFARARLALGDRATLQQTVLEEALLPGSFDVVTMWDVLEHVIQPVQFVSAAAAHLRPGGLLVLNVPRIDSLMARLLGARWPLLLAEHLNYFTEQSIGNMAEAAGLRLIGTGSRPSSFSLGYVFYRLEQHRLPFTALLRRLVQQSPFHRISLPLWMGEVYAVLRKP